MILLLYSSNTLSNFMIFNSRLKVWKIYLEILVGLVEQTLMYSYQHTAKFEFSHPELRVKLLIKCL